MTTTATGSGAAATSDAPSEHHPVLLVLVRIGAVRLAIDAREVREVARAVPMAEPPPNSRGVAGMIVLRGEPTPVVDLGLAIGVANGRRDQQARMLAVKFGESAVCLLVDGVDGLHEVSRDELTAPLELVDGAFSGRLDFVAPTPTGEPVGVISVQRVLTQVLNDEAPSADPDVVRS